MGVLPCPAHARDAHGRPQHSGCVKALRELEAAGYFALPAAVGPRAGPGPPRGLSQPMPVPSAVPAVETVEGDPQRVRRWVQLCRLQVVDEVFD